MEPLNCAWHHCRNMAAMGIMMTVGGCALSEMIFQLANKIEGKYC